jgi:hypothetical protein
MIPPDDLQPLLAGRFFGVKNVLAGHRETIIGRIIASIYERMQRMNLATDLAVSNFGIAAKKRAATFAWISLRSVRANFVG